MKKVKTLKTKKKKTVTPVKKGGKKTTSRTVKREIKKSSEKLVVQANEIVKEKGIQKSEEFKMFFLWNALPSIFVGKDEEALRKLGVNNPEHIELLSIKTQSEFAKQHKVRKSTLSDWNKKINTSNVNPRTEDFFKGLTKNVLAAFYEKTLLNADASRVRLWLEEFAGKKPEGSNAPVPALLGSQFTQVIINLKNQYDSDLKSEYERIIREKGGVPGTGGIHPSPSNEEEGTEGE